MQQAKSFKELKRMAKLQMQGKMGTLIAAMFLQELIVIGITLVVSNVIPGTDTISNILYYIVTFIVQLILGTIAAGMAYLHLHVACNMEAKVSDIFYAIKECPDKAIKIELILAIINSISMLPANYISFSTANMPLTEESLLLMSSTTLVCSMLYLILTLGFFPVFYMMLDFPSMTVKEIYKKSWNLMRGYKFRYFLLQLSFVPLIFLSFFALFIPLIWIIPYMSMTETNFYLDLISIKNGGAVEA